MRRPRRSPLFPYTTLFRSRRLLGFGRQRPVRGRRPEARGRPPRRGRRSEEHTSELQSHVNLVCRLLLEKKKKKAKTPSRYSANRKDQPDKLDQCQALVNST